MDDIVIRVIANEQGFADLNKQLDALKAKNKQLEDQMTKGHEKQQSQHKEKSSMIDKLKDGFAELGPAIVAAFSVEAIIEFGKESIKAFEEAEQAANDLKSTIINLAGGTEKDFERMKISAERLSVQMKNLFTVKDIEKGQKSLLQMNLTLEQTNKLMPTIAAIAAKNHKSIDEMSETIGKAISEGRTGALTLYGIKFKDLGNIADNTNQ